MSLLHDIGRWCEYESGTAHEYASAQIARGVLKRALFCEDDTEQIYEAILHHRKSNAEDSLSYLLYRADKLSRSCYQCTAQSTCHRLSRNDQLHI